MKKSIPTHPLLNGALLLTIAGILSRLIGFFYKIFLSRRIGAEGLGIYQLIFPVMGICFSLTSAGIQTAISRYVSKSIGVGNLKATQKYLQTGLLLAITLALLVSAILFGYADFIAVELLGEERCASLLKIISFSYVPACIHACLNGYFYGKKQSAVPAISQLIEQVVRVGSVYFIDQLLTSQGKHISISLAVMGLVFGEIAGMIFSINFVRLPLVGLFTDFLEKDYFTYGKELLSMALPLTASRLIINLFNSTEHILIPGRLEAFGYTTSEALSVFGVLTGMSLSVISFPSVITNSVSVILLPTIAEADARKNHSLIHSAIRRTIFACLFLGFGACLLFLLTGNFIGNVIFENALAGTFVKTLSWICPFLYLNSTLNSILHGLGYTKTTLFIGLSGCVLRILFIYFGIPYLGIAGYMYGLIGSQIVMASASILILFKTILNHK